MRSHILRRAPGFRRAADTIERQVDYTEGSARGDTSGKVMKPAKLKNGTELSVADFIEIGDMIEIDTREGGSYKGRAK